MPICGGATTLRSCTGPPAETRTTVLSLESRWSVFHDARLRQDPRTEATFTVEDLVDGRPIGTADYRDVDPFAGQATVGIIIGEPSHWGGGYGSEALRLLLKHLFGACRIRRVERDTWSGNERAIRAAQSAGFVEEARRRSAARVGDQWYDSVVYGLLYEEWVAR